MPELPEVESIKLQLQKFLIGHKIEGVNVRNPKYAFDVKEVVGAKFKGVRRFAKVLSIDLDNNFSIVIHIKLTGQLIYRGPNLKKVPELSKKVVDGIPGKHTHVVFNLDKDGALYYNDVRRFGWIKIIKSDELRTTGFIGKLGPEPPVMQGSGGKSFAAHGAGSGLLTLEKFREITRSTSRAIKILLMDQTKIAGVGNIYANDALWLAEIHPQRVSKELSDEEIKKLYEAVIEVLKRGLKWGGASELAFVTPDGGEGNYQDHTLSYGKTGEVCERCHKARFEKSVVGGRGTYLCPVCQVIESR